ncbi:MAG TPA: hypothetical protein VN253_13940 [Kofleriaceae bacterium]|nr:hypothetical protein [Kofleriaceae bacterium]
MRALLVVLLLVLAAPALADTPPPAEAPPTTAPPTTAPPADASAAATPPADAPAAAAPEVVTTPAPAPPKQVVIAPPSTIAPTGGEPAPVREEPAPPAARNGYRLQVAVADGAVIAMSFLVDQFSKDGAGRPGGLATLTIASYFFAVPMIHGIHDQGKRALGSFALRAGLPILLGLLGEQIDGAPECTSCQDTLRSDGQIIGLTAGVLISMAVDAAVLARPISRRTERKPRAAWAPALRGVRGGATAGVLGTF